MAVLDEATIRELAGFRPEHGVVTSCYLDVDGRRFPRRAEYEQELDRLLRHARARVNGDGVPARDLQRIERHVRDGVDRSRTRGLAMFACSAEGFWRAEALPVPVRSQLVVGHAPAVGQLEAALHRYEPIGVLLADRQQVRVLVFELGELTEYAEVVADLFRDVDERDDRARGEMQGKVDDRDQQHLRRAADAAFRVFSDHPFAHLLIGAPQALVRGLEAALHPYLRERLRDRTGIAVTDSVDAISEAALAAEAAIERDRERAVLRDLRERLARGERAVAGLGDTLGALADRRVDALIVSAGYHAHGWSCSDCGRLAVVGPTCPRCQAALREEEDVIAAAIDDALTASTRVEVCDASADLDVVGRIGALLRYYVAAGEVTVGVDLGGTKTLAVAVDHGRGEVVGQLRRPTPVGARPLIEGVALVVEDLSRQAGLGDDTRVGIGVAGLVDLRGVLRLGPNQPGVVELDVLGELTDRLGPRVVVDNDAHCAARAELRSGVAEGRSDVVLLTLGTGIGGAIVVGGEVVRGANGMAGEPGHAVVDPAGPPCPCGQRGCWERYASGAGLARMARDAAEAGRLDAVLARCAGEPALIRGEDVVVVAREGDAGALGVLSELSWWTALGIANLTAILDPELVVLGGGLVEAADLWLPKVRTDLADLLVAAAHRRLPDVEVAAHGVEAAALGAADLARQSARG